MLRALLSPTCSRRRTSPRLSVSMVADQVQACQFRWARVRLDARLLRPRRAGKILLLLLTRNPCCRSPEHLARRLCFQVPLAWPKCRLSLAGSSSPTLEAMMACSRYLASGPNQCAVFGCHQSRSHHPGAERFRSGEGIRPPWNSARRPPPSDSSGTSVPGGKDMSRLEKM